MAGSRENWTTTPLGRLLADRVRQAFHPALPPDPWPVDLDRAVRSSDAVAVCPRCFTPVTPFHWFCPECACAVGGHNNWMSYLHIFSIGEVLRSGVGPHARFTVLTVPGYLVVGLAEYSLFAPLYYIRLALNWRRVSQQPPPVPQEEVDGAP